MRIGFYTSTFNDRPLEEVVEFAASAGFDAIEIDVGGHLKTPERVRAAVALARDRNLFVCWLPRQRLVAIQAARQGPARLAAFSASGPY